MRRQAIAEIQAEIDKGMASGPGQPFDLEDFKARARAEYAKRNSA